MHLFLSIVYDVWSVFAVIIGCMMASQDSPVGDWKDYSRSDKWLIVLFFVTLLTAAPWLFAGILMGAVYRLFNILEGAS